MSDVDRAIRERLAIFGNDVQGNAIRAVLDLHRADDGFAWDGSKHAVCHTCAASVQYPCATVLAIARALGVDAS